MFYESTHSQKSDLIKLESGLDFSFPPHLHDSFELIAVTEGQMVVTIAKKQYFLESGNAVLVFPNQVHALHTPAHSRHSLCIFSSEIVRAYARLCAGSHPVSNLFSPEQALLDKLIVSPNLNGLEAKGILYLLCAQFHTTAQYTTRQEGSEYLLHSIFQFVHSHYTHDCSLEALASYTGYHSVYLSRYFKERTGLTFTEYVNRHRINEASFLLDMTDDKVLEIALNCGFRSLRSFNRNFLLLTGLSPRDYRRMKRRSQTPASQLD